MLTRPFWDIFLRLLAKANDQEVDYPLGNKDLTGL